MSEIFDALQSMNERQHYAFLITEAEFDAIVAIPYWSEPGRHQKGEINHHDGGRGLYFEDLTGIC